ncbi:MAG: DUF6884 domain-containing protein [Promethearchaeota archaeon]
MRILVVGSCGKRKLYSPPDQPKCNDIDGNHDIVYWKQQFPSMCAPARDMYLGPQNKELVKAVDLLRTIDDVEVQLVIISAGFGMLHEEDIVPPYDCSFTTMKIANVRERSSQLQLKEAITQLVETGFDLIYLALGKRYLETIGNDILSTLHTTTISFHGQNTEHLVRISCSAETVKTFSRSGHKIHGVVGFKGDLLRVLVRYALTRRNPENEVRKWKRPTHLRNLIYRLRDSKQTTIE